MTAAQGPIADAVRDGTLPGRVWLYSNYHCNLACSYCLTESSPRSERREAVLEMVQHLPLVLLNNGTLFVGERLERAAKLAHPGIALQISLDSHLPDINDMARGPDNFAKVVESVPRLLERGVQVRIATTTAGPLDSPALDPLKALVASWGVPADDHIVRPIVRRGRADERYPSSCGEIGWQAMGNIALLLAEFRANGWPVLYPHVAPKNKATSAAWVCKPSPATSPANCASPPTAPSGAASVPPCATAGSTPTCCSRAPSCRWQFRPTRCSLPSAACRREPTPRSAYVEHDQHRSRSAPLGDPLREQ